MMSQNDEVLAWLAANPKGITALEALAEIGCFRLAARISDLRADGYTIETVTERLGGKTYARYVLHWGTTPPQGSPENELRALWGDR